MKILSIKKLVHFKINICIYSICTPLLSFFTVSGNMRISVKVVLQERFSGYCFLTILIMFSENGCHTAKWFSRGFSRGRYAIFVSAYTNSGRERSFYRITIKNYPTEKDGTAAEL